MSVQETNVRRCGELRAQGLKLREIAAITGLAISTVSQYLVDPDGSRALARKTRGKCRDCGRPIRSDLPKRGNPKRCPPCARAFVTARSREDMEVSYRTWIEWYGARPSAMDWNLSYARKKAAPGRLSAIEAAHRKRRWPSVFNVQRTYGSWNEFVALMGDRTLSRGQRLDVGAWRSNIARAHRQRREVWADELVRRWNSGEPTAKIAEDLGISKAAVHGRVGLLRRQGYRLQPRRKPRRGVNPSRWAAPSGTCRTVTDM